MHSFGSFEFGCNTHADVSALYKQIMVVQAYPEACQYLITTRCQLLNLAMELLKRVPQLLRNLCKSAKF